jgi:hypothetical protein
VEAVLLKFVPFCGTEIHCGVEARLRWLTVDLEPCTFEMAMERFFWQRFWKTHTSENLFEQENISAILCYIIRQPWRKQKDNGGETHHLITLH